MSKLTPKKFSQRQIELSKRIEKELTGWGFQHYVRHCGVTPLKYGFPEDSDPYVVETWNNESMADFIVTDLLELTSPGQIKQMEDV